MKEEREEEKKMMRNERRERRRIRVNNLSQSIAKTRVVSFL